MRGLNPTGSAFVAQQLVTHLPASAPASTADGAASIVVAAGPFTTTDDVTYEPLGELLRYCAGGLWSFWFWNVSSRAVYVIV